MLQRQDSLNFRHREKLNRLKAFFVISLFFLTGCGLDVVKDVYADPVNHNRLPTVDSYADTMIFDFSTSKLTDSTNMGHTYIYYKIYNKLSTLNSEQSYLSSLSTDENRMAASATQMIQYGYKELRIDKSGNGGAGRDTEVFMLTNAPHNVKICLYAQGYSSGITVDGIRLGSPCRINSKNFNFNEPSDGSNKPLSDDDDTKKFASEADGFYVVLFSVFSTFDEVFDTLYSPIHYLGAIKIAE